MKITLTSINEEHFTRIEVAQLYSLDAGDLCG